MAEEVGSVALDAQTVPAEVPATPGRPVEWSPWLGYFVILWLADLGYLLYVAFHGVAPFTGPLPQEHLIRIGIGLLLAGLLTFAVPVALVDESSHLRSRWWLAWLWPATLAGMLLADFLVAGAVLVPVLNALKSH